MSLKSHQSPHHGKSDVWLTPPEIIDALGPFDLDPCAAPSPRPWPTAKSHITLPNNGLTAIWANDFVWCNPPFSDSTPWLAKMADHGHGIALCSAGTETRWFFAHIWRRADAVLFLERRIHYHHPDGTRAKANCGAAMCLVAYGDEAVRRLAGCGLPGAFTDRWRMTSSDTEQTAPTLFEAAS